jgi:hypothetical protein
MQQKWETWTGLSINKNTGEEYDFYIFKDGKTIKFPVEEARVLFPKAVEMLERSVLMYRLFT